MAARPYILWNPGANADLHVLPGAGPLVVSSTEADRETWAALVAPWIVPFAFTDFIVGYENDVRAPAGGGGLRVRGYQYMPKELAFLGTDPANREPRPFDMCDLFYGNSWPWISLGYRLGIRGWVGSRYAGLLNTVISASWADAQARNPGDLRGAWSGLALTSFQAGPDMAARHLVSVCHGKRRGDVAWEYRAGYLDVPEAPAAVAEVVTPWPASDGRVRIVSSGAPGGWDLTLQHWDPSIGPSGDWVTDLIQPADLWAHDPGEEDYVALMASLIPGATQWQPAAPLSWPTQELWFPDLELEQLEPWVIDVADWSMREWYESWAWLAGVALPDMSQDLRMPHNDLAHVPLGSVGAPLALREFDADLGWHMVLGPASRLGTPPSMDMRGIAQSVFGGYVMPAVPCDGAYLGPDAPTAVLWRVRFNDLEDMAINERRALWSAGPLQTAVPSIINNAIGVFVQRITSSTWNVIARCYNQGSGWADATTTLTAAEIADKGDLPFLIAWAWTGARGSRSGGHPSRSLRLVIDGTTRAELSGLNLYLNRGQIFRVGWQHATMQCAACDLGAGAVFGEAITDEEIAGAFTEVTGPFQNNSFETASADGRPGEAEAWNWTSYQGQGGWAEFNASDPDLQAWQRAREDFAAGWENNEDWVDAWIVGLITAALFNEGVPAFETTTELFELWGWPDFGSPTYVGPPWRDAWTLIAPPDELPTATGWTGWFDAFYGGHAEPLREEQFREEWGTDPLSTVSGPWWYPGTGVGGRLRGAALSWPVTLPPERAWLWLFNDAREVYRVQLTVGTYADATSLAAMVNAAIAAEVPAGYGLTVTAWDDGDNSGLLLGWDLSTPSSCMWILGAKASDPWGEARPYLGLSGLGPWGTRSEIVFPCSLATLLPFGVPTSEHMLLDSWSLIDWSYFLDPVIGAMVLEYEQAGAVFDSLWDPPGTYLERFDLEGWFGLGAVWVAAFDPGDLWPALFIGCPDPWQECFDPASWPDEPFPV